MKNFQNIFSVIPQIPTLIVAGDSVKVNQVLAVIQAILFVVLFAIIIGVIIMYFKTISLKSEKKISNKQVEKNLEKMEKILRNLVKVGAIIFVVVILSQIILGNFYE